jgi:Tol biopolymer transport system component
LLRRCLQKDRRKRLADASDAHLEIDDAESSETFNVTGTSDPMARPWSRFGWVAAAAAVAVAMVMTPLAVTHLREQLPVAADPVRFQVALPEKTSLSLVGGFAISPDGRFLAFSATGPDGMTRFWIRTLNALEARALAGTEGATGSPPIWSPDSRSLAFEAGGKLKRIDVAGGPAQTLCDASSGVIGGAWNRDGVIVFGRGYGPIMRVSASGGAPTPLTVLDPSHQEGTHGFPSFLPDGQHFLYLRLGPSGGETNGTYVGALDAKPAEQPSKRIVATEFESAYVPPAGGAQLGRVLFRRERTLLVQTFDHRTFELVGEAVSVAEQLRTLLAIGSFSASTTAVLVYQTGANDTDSQLTWFDRTGTVRGTVGERGNIVSVALSPNGAHSAVSRRTDKGNLDIWLVDFALGTGPRFTFGPFSSGSPVWSPDAARIVFRTLGGDPVGLYQKRANGATNEDILLISRNEVVPTGWSPDGHFLLYTEIDPKTKSDLWLLPLDAEHKPTAFLRTEFNEDQAHFSPDGRWVAYHSDESGRGEIYLRGFSARSAGAKVLVSTDGGSHPRWRSDGKELLYLAPDGTMMAADVLVGAEPRVTPAKPLFKFPSSAMGRTIASPAVAFWDVSPDGRRFLVPVPIEESSQPSFTVVLNWEGGLAAREKR